MATVTSAKTSFNFLPTVTLAGTYEASSLADGDDVEMAEIPARFRATYIRVAFDDLGAGTTMDVGDTDTVDLYVDGQDTASAAGTVEWYPAADEKGKLYTTANTIQFRNLGAAATGSVSWIVQGYMDYEGTS
jgi:hypothetical protein